MELSGFLCYMLLGLWMSPAAESSLERALHGYQEKVRAKVLLKPLSVTFNRWFYMFFEKNLKLHILWQLTRVGSDAYSFQISSCIFS